MRCGPVLYGTSHATQAYLMALCLADVMPKAVSTPVAGADTSALQRMALRIARNREVLGLHYKSDSAAGKTLAEESFKLLKKCRSVSSTSTTKPGIIQRAQQEWEPRN